jgi:hypothetical protein
MELLSLDVAIFIWCLVFHLAICVLMLLDSNVQGNLGFYMAFLPIGLQPIGQNFQLLTFNFVLRISLFISTPLILFQISHSFQNLLCLGLFSELRPYCKLETLALCHCIFKLLFLTKLVNILNYTWLKIFKIQKELTHSNHFLWLC